MPEEIKAVDMQELSSEDAVAPPKAKVGPIGNREKSIANLIPFKKGQSGNPRGRPRKDIDLAVLAQKHAEKAIATLVEVMSDERATPAARVSAASEILDRGFGRAPQSLDVKHDISFSEQFEDFIMSISSRRSAPMIDVQASDAAE